MTDNHLHKKTVIFILILGLGIGFTLPWLTNDQSNAAQQEVRDHDKPPEAVTVYYVASTGSGTAPEAG